MKLAFLVPVALIFMVASALAQTVTEVETRGKGHLSRLQGDGWFRGRSRG